MSSDRINQYTIDMAIIMPDNGPQYWWFNGQIYQANSHGIYVNERRGLFSEGGNGEPSKNGREIPKWLSGSHLRREKSRMPRGKPAPPSQRIRHYLMY